MKRILAPAILSFLVLSADAATVTGTIVDNSGTPLNGGVIKFLPGSNPGNVSGSAVAGIQKTVNLSTNGTFSTTLLTGNYTASVNGYSWGISVPAGTNSYNISDISTNLYTFPFAGIVKVSQYDTNATFLTNKIIAGNFITVSVTNSGGNEQMVISGTGGGDGSVYVNGAGVSSPNLTNSSTALISATSTNISVHPTNIANAQISSVAGEKITSGTIPEARIPTLSAPTILSYANGTHNHESAAGGGTLSGSAIASGTVGPARLGSGALTDGYVLKLTGGAASWQLDATGGGGGGSGDDVLVNAVDVTNPNFLDADFFKFYITTTNVSGYATNLTGAHIATDAIGTDELNVAAVESEIEGFIDLQDLQGAVVDGQIPAAIARDAEVAAAYQPLDADLTDLADGTLTGSKVGTGIDGGNISAGTVAAARIDTAMATDAEVAAGYQPLDADLTDLADGTLTGSKVGAGIDAGNITAGTVGTARLGSGSASSSTFLRGDGTWSTPSGSCDVTAASNFGTDNRLIKSDGTAKGVGATGITVDDSDNMTVPGTITAGSSGSTAGALILPEGTAVSLTANQFTIYSPTDVAAGGLAYVVPAAAASGIMRATDSSGVMTITHDGGFSHLAGTLGDAQIADGAIDGGSGGEIADGSVTADDLGADSVSASELNATGVEAELEAVLDLNELQGAVTDSQVPNTITVDLATTATTANAGDSATAFFGSGTLESARLDADVIVATLGAAFDGQGEAIVTGSKVTYKVPFNMTVTGYDLDGLASGDITIDVWVEADPYDGSGVVDNLPANADSITASATPSLTAQIGKTSTTLTGWTTTIAAGSMISFVVEGTPTAEWAAIKLYGTKN